MELEFEVCLCGKEICDEKCTLSLINNINIIDNFDNHQLYIDDHINIIKTQKTIKDKAYNLNLYNRKYFNTKDFFENFFRIPSNNYLFFYKAALTFLIWKFFTSSVKPTK